MTSKTKNIIRRLPSKGSSILSAFTLALVGATSAHAVNYTTWVDTGTPSDTWGNAANWSPQTVPNSATTFALFDGAGDTSPITLGGNAYQLQALVFGNAETTGSSIPAYTIGAAAGDTLDFATTSASVGTPTGFIEDTGSVNTAAETIDANIVLDFGYASTATYIYQVNNSSGANVVLNGAVSSPVSTPTSGAETDLELGSSATGTYGNLVFGQSVLGVRLDDLGTKGAIVFNPTNTATTLTDVGSGGGYSITFLTGHTGESSPNLEAEAGNTIVQGGNAVDYDYNQSTAGASSYFIQADSGATLAIGALYDGATSTTAGTTQTVYLDGAGTGVVYGNDTVRNPVGYLTYQSTASVVKDGTGAWAFTGNGGGTAAGRGETYQGGTTVADGTFLVLGGAYSTTQTTDNSPTGSGTVTVDPTTSAEAATAKPILGGNGYIGGALQVNSGGEVAPGGAATGGATTTASITSPLGSIGKLTIGTTVTAVAGSTFAFDINSAGAFNVGTGAGTADNITSIGAMTLAAVNLTLNDIDAGSSTIVTGDYFDLLDYASTSAITFSDYTNGETIDIGANAYTLNIGATETQLVYAGAAPEPSTRGLLLLAIPGLLFLARKRKFLQA
jgi:hypothetical protein